MIIWILNFSVKYILSSHRPDNSTPHDKADIYYLTSETRFVFCRIKQSMYFTTWALFCEESNSSRCCLHTLFCWQQFVGGTCIELFFLFCLTSVGFKNVSDLRCSFCVRILNLGELLSGFNLLLACGDCSN